MNCSDVEASAPEPTGANSTAAHRANAVLPRLVRLLKETMGEGSPLKQLPIPQVRAIGHLLRAPGETLTDLAAGLGIALGTASETVDGLVELGMVERETNPADRRQVLLSLAPHAASMAREIERQRIGQFEELFASLTDEEAAGFLKGLDRWAEVLQSRVDIPSTTPDSPRKA